MQSCMCWNHKSTLYPTLILKGRLQEPNTFMTVDCSGKEEEFRTKGYKSKFLFSINSAPANHIHISSGK